LLTFVVYVPGKKSLKFDLSVIVLLQVSALVYGLYTIHSERPAYMVFALDRFNVVAGKDVDPKEAEQYGFDRKPWRGPLMVVAELPSDPQRRQKLTEETLFEGKPDIERRPEFWIDYDDGLPGVLEAAIPLDQLLVFRPPARAAIEAMARKAGQPVPNLRFLPVIGKNNDFALVLRPSDGSFVGAVATDPWLQ
jgi:hypothetical protein